MAELFAERERRFPEATHDETAPIFEMLLLERSERAGCCV
jgi:hypothetical protein